MVLNSCDINLVFLTLHLVVMVFSIYIYMCIYSIYNLMVYNNLTYINLFIYFISKHTLQNLL